MLKELRRRGWNKAVLQPQAHSQGSANVDVGDQTALMIRDTGDVTRESTTKLVSNTLLLVS